MNLHSLEGGGKIRSRRKEKRREKVTCVYEFDFVFYFDWNVGCVPVSDLVRRSNESDKIKPKASIALRFWLSNLKVSACENAEQNEKTSTVIQT